MSCGSSQGFMQNKFVISHTCFGGPVKQITSNMSVVPKIFAVPWLFHCLDRHSARIVAVPGSSWTALVHFLDMSNLSADVVWLTYTKQFMTLNNYERNS